MNEAVKRAVWHLEECGLSRKEIAATCLIPYGTLRHVMAGDDTLPGPVGIVNLARLASVNGWDELSDMTSADWKRNRPVLNAELNGSSDDEIIAATEHAGLARHYERRREYLTAYQNAQMTAAYWTLAAQENLALAGYPVVSDPAQRSLFV